MRSVLLVLLLSVAPTGASADQIGQIMELRGDAEIVRKAYEECISAAVALFGDDFTFEYQSNSLGLAPDDPAWKRLAAIYAEYYEGSCNSMSPDAILPVIREAYETRFSDKERDHLVEFLSSPLGRKLVEVDVEVNKTLNEKWTEDVVRETRAANQRLEERLEEFRRSLEEEPEEGKPSGV